jgi:hypothetical protein
LLNVKLVGASRNQKVKGQRYCKCVSESQILIIQNPIFPSNIWFTLYRMRCYKTFNILTHSFVFVGTNAYL